MKLLSCCWVILCSLVAAYGDSPTNEFAFSDLTIQVADLDGNPVPGAEVRVYHTEWYLAYPRGDFARTAADGACTLRVPQGLYRIVVGGGTAYHAAGSGRGLFLAEAARVAGDTRVNLKPDASSALRFLDRLDQPIDADTLQGAPPDLLPNCRLAQLGATRNGGCQLEYRRGQAVTVFFLRSPAALADGYFVPFANVDPGVAVDLRMSAQRLRAVRFEGYAPEEQAPGPVDWVLSFPYQDFERHWGHTSFTVSGPATAWFGVDYFDCYPRIRLWDARRQDNVAYEFQYRGVDLSAPVDPVLQAGGPLTRGFKYVPLAFDPNRCQLMLGPTLDAYGNELRYYHPEQAQTPAFRHPFRVQEITNGPVLYEGTLDVTSDNLGFQLSVGFPTSAVFRLEWDLGPYDGTRIIEGRLDDPACLWPDQPIDTENVTVHAPAWAAPKGAQLAARLEQACGVMSRLMESPPKVTPERNFYIHPFGSWASNYGQQLFYHGFAWWHPRNPWAWNATIFHELGHRLESEAFTYSSDVQPFDAKHCEAVAELLSHSTLQALYGEAFAIPEWSERAHRFFDYLAAPANPPNPVWYNLFFFEEVYIPRRFGANAHQVFFRNWLSCSQGLTALQYRQEEICAALYSAICQTNLAWAWRLSGFDVTDERVNQAQGRMAWVETLPQPQYVTPGGSAIFTAGVRGEPVRLQWKHDGRVLPGQTNAVLSLNPCRTEDAGAYSLEVGNDAMRLETPPVFLVFVPQYADPTRPGDQFVYSLKLAARPAGGGSLAATADQTPDASGKFPAGTVVQLTATPGPGWLFSGWSGALNGSANPASHTLSGDLAVAATFVPQYPDITRPGDPIVPTSSNSPGNEGAAKAIDGSTETKYLNFDKLNAGFTVTPAAGRTVVTGLGLTSANDVGGRDPASYRLEGSNDGRTFDLIAAGDVPAFPNRFTEQDFCFANPVAYTTYRLTFPTVAGGASADAMQIAEAQLFGTVAALPRYRLTLAVTPADGGAIVPSPAPDADGTYPAGTRVNLTATPAPGRQFGGWSGALSGSANPTSLTLSGDLAVTATFVAQYADITRPGDPVVPTSLNSPGNEGAAKAIDDSTATKYFNFDKLNSGFTITPSAGRTVVIGLGLTSANDVPARDPASYRLEGANDGRTFALIAAGDVPAFPGRLAEQVFLFDNTVAYTSYRLIFPTVAGGASADAMQIAEAQLFGKVAALPRYRLTATVNHPGWGQVFLQASEPADAEGKYPAGASISLTAIPEANCIFVNWNDDPARTNTSTTVILNGDTTVTANFALLPPASYRLTLAVTPADSGAIVPSPAPDASGAYPAGTRVNLTATPAPGRQFSGWSGALGGSANPTLVTMVGDLAVTATFVAQYADITKPGDPVVPTSLNSPGNEGAAKAIDDSTATKYFNFDKLNAGFTITPSAGRTVVTGLGLTSANDVPARDPASYRLEGANDGRTFALIAAGDVPAFPGRFVEQDFLFDNTVAYTSYRLIFPTVAGGASADAMQIAEAQLFGKVAALPRYRLTATVNHPGWGQVFLQASEPADAEGKYPAGASISLTAIPEANYTFVNWNDDPARTNTSTTVILNGDTIVTANFALLPPARYRLTTTVNHPGWGQVFLQASEPADAEGKFPDGASISLTAIPEANYTFVNWNDDPARTNASTTVILSGDTIMTANFALLPPASYRLTLAVTPADGGAIVPSPAPDASGAYPAGTRVNLTATPAPGRQFSGWSGAMGGSANPTLVTMVGDLAVTATFVAQYADITKPGDPVVPTSLNSPGNEGAAKAIDDSTATKYFNFDKLNSGFTITPSAGRTVVIGLGLTSANDVPARDPASYRLEGSLDGKTFVTIAAGAVPAFPSRLQFRNVFFTNETAYRVYRVIFPTVAQPTKADGMQIAEVQLLGTLAPAAPKMTATCAQGVLTLTWDASGLILETTGDLTPPVPWTAVPGVGANRFETPMPDASRFYRLRQ